jgi:hypothetical protein
MIDPRIAQQFGVDERKPSFQSLGDSWADKPRRREPLPNAEVVGRNPPYSRIRVLKAHFFPSNSSTPHTKHRQCSVEARPTLRLTQIVARRLERPSCICVPKGVFDHARIRGD